MKAITIKQPWAWLIVEGIKDIENRTWPTKFRGRVLIHAGAKADISNSLYVLNEVQYNEVIKRLSGNCFPKYYNSAIIGSIEIVDCVLNHTSVWAQHEANVRRKIDGEYKLVEVPVYNWVLANPIKFSQPIPAKGSLSFWNFEMPEEWIQECTGCDEKFHIDEITEDSEGNPFCPECWKELSELIIINE